RAAAPGAGPVGIPEELDRRPRDPREEQRRRIRRDRGVGRAVGRQSKDARYPGARLVDALDGGGGEGTAADRGVEELPERGPQGDELREPEGDLLTFLGFGRGLPLEPGPKIARRAQRSVRQGQRRARIHVFSVTYPLIECKYGNVFDARTALATTLPDQAREAPIGQNLAA